MDKSSIHDIVLVGGSTRYLQRDSVLRIRIFQGIYLDNGTGTCSLNVSFILLCAVLRIRDPVPYWPRDPGLVKNHDPDPGWTIGSYSESLETIFWFKMLQFCNSDLGWEKFGSGMEKIHIRDKHPGSAKLIGPAGLSTVPLAPGSDCLGIISRVFRQQRHVPELPTPREELTHPKWRANFAPVVEII